jgi:D-alanyl-D-alanine carboxypeptidase/D-alanyl-D-alanine-endopeptidase (penicillin-binding protein 4)
MPSSSARLWPFAVPSLAVSVVLVATLATVPQAEAAAPAPSVAVAAAPAPLSAVDQRIKRLVTKRAKVPQLGSDLAIRIMDPRSGNLIHSSQSLEAQLPASNTKLVTAMVALKTMGPNARATTRTLIQQEGARVVIVGGGDPMLTSDRLNLLAKRTVQGLAAASASGKAPASVTLTYNDALFPAHSNARGWRSHYIPSEVNPVTALQRYGHRGTRPSRDAAAYFAARLAAHGVKASLVGRTTSTSGNELARVDGVTVQTAITRMLYISDNNVAELLARRSAIAAGQRPTWAGWQRTARQVLVAEGVPMSKVRIVDGSGLSRSTRLTAKSIAWLLTKATRSKDPRMAGFLKAMTVSGRTGTLAKSYGRYTTAPSKCAVGRIHAKTGHLSGVYALSGVAIARDGHPRVFSFVANGVSSRHRGLEVRRALDRLAATVVGCY